MYLLHTGMGHNEATIIQHYYSHNKKDDIRTDIKVCKKFPKNKKQSLKYGNLP